jgi:hypothetical protein
MLESMNWFEENIGVLRERFPALAERALQPGLKEQVSVLQAQDGLPTYAFRKEGKLHPLTDPGNPQERINQELARWHDKITDFSRPILVAGLHPGEEVLRLFQYREQAAGKECEQPLWICVDSMLTFCGFLQAYDARALIVSERVEIFWHEDVPAKVAWLRQQPEFSYIFSMVSLSPPQTQLTVFKPFLELVREREDEMVRFQQENRAYYDALTDEQLADVLSGRAGRAPRLLVPSCPWSTVIQYSIRDTCRAFQAAGWETEIVDGPTVLTSHCVMESINRFKPDVFLYVSHLRTEAPGVIPDNLMMVSWVQDPLPTINSVEAAHRWNLKAAVRGRDLLTGYTDQLRPFGYLEDRLVPLNMIVDSELFRPRTLTAGQKEKYGCDVCFASNAGLPTDRVVRERLVSLLKPYGCSEPLLMQIHDQLWTHYRSGETITRYEQLKAFALRIPEFEPLFNTLDKVRQDALVELLFWRLNDLIYRHTVLEWLDDYASKHPGFRLNLYGNDWDQHPRFSKYARSTIEHGEELSIAYQAARYGLHLNAIEQSHQRMGEITASGGHILGRVHPVHQQQLEACRQSRKGGDVHELPVLMHTLAAWNMTGLERPENLQVDANSMLEHYVDGRAQLFDAQAGLFKLLEQAPEATGTTVHSCQGTQTVQRIRDAVIGLLMPENGHQNSELRMPGHVSAEHSAVYRTAWASMARKAGDWAAFDRLLPSSFDAEAAERFRFIYAMECCFAGRLEQAIEQLRSCTAPDGVEAPGVRLALVLGQYDHVLEELAQNPMVSHQSVVMSSLAAYYLAQEPLETLPIWDEEYDSVPGSWYWRAMLCREAGDYARALTLFDMPGQDRASAGWLGIYGGVEQQLTRYAAQLDLEDTPLDEPTTPTGVTSRLLKGLQGPVDETVFDDLEPMLKEGARFHLAGSYSCLVLVAAAAACAWNLPDKASGFLKNWLPRYLSSSSMFRADGVHSRFCNALLIRLMDSVPEFEQLFCEQVMHSSLEAV